MATPEERVGEGERTFPLGMRLGEGGRYELRKLVGRGAMAEVYKAVDKRLGDRIVAVKTLSRSVADHPFADRMRQLFIQEAKAIARVRDENVVGVLDFGNTSDGTPFMVMEFLSGTDLGVFLKKIRHLEIAEAVDTILAVCAGVHACHLAGIVHRDLKPANIFLTRTANGDQPKVLDFSVAKLPLPAASSVERSSTDLIVGTPSYMSPEQALGRSATPFSDQYSIGALLYRCLTGRPPQDVPPRPRELRPEIPLRLEEVILRAIAPAPEKRFPTVHDLGRALLPFASSAGRGRWNGYYGSVPRAVDPMLSEPIAGQMPAPPTIGAKRADRILPVVISEGTTSAARRQESTTVLVPADRLAPPPPNAAEHVGSTTAAAAEHVIPATVRLVAPVDPFAPTDRQSPPAPTRDLTVRIARTWRGVRGRSRASIPRASLLLPVGMALLLVVTFAFASVRLGRTRHPAPAILHPPWWAAPAVSTSASARPPKPEPILPEESPAAPADGEVDTSPRASSLEAIPKPIPDARPRRRAKRHATTVFAIPIEYGPYGAPILR